MSAFVRYGKLLWDFRTGEDRIYWSKRHKIGSDGVIEPGGPCWRFVRGEFQVDPIEPAEIFMAAQNPEGRSLE